MEKGNEEGRDIRKEVTERWLIAVDYLIEQDIVRSYRKFSEKTGIDHQRINIFKSFVNNGGRASYANTDHLVIIRQKYNVSYEFLLNGIGDIISNDQVSDQDKLLDDSNIKLKIKELGDLEIKSQVEENKAMIRVLAKKIEILEMMDKRI